MTTTTTYPIPGYPTVSLTTDDAPTTIRPMVPEDQAAMLNLTNNCRKLPQFWPFSWLFHFVQGIFFEVFGVFSSSSRQNEHCFHG